MKGTRGSIEAPRRGIRGWLWSAALLLLLPLKAFAEAVVVLWANHKGSEGSVKIGANAVGELRGWEVNHSNEPIEDTVLNDTDRTFQAGLNAWSGSATAWWDETDTAQIALTVGASVTLTFHPEGTGTGNENYTGTALVTAITRRAAIQGMVEVDFTFQGTGALS